MKLKSTFNTVFTHNGKAYEIIIESYATVVRVNIKPYGWAMWTTLPSISRKTASVLRLEDYATMYENW